MSEPKLCPYRTVRRTHYVPTDFLKDESLAPAMCEVGEFLPCLQDKCAMWRMTHYENLYQNAVIDGKVVSTIPPDMPEPEQVGYCGLAGKP